MYIHIYFSLSPYLVGALPWALCPKVLMQSPCKSASHLSHVLALVLRPTEVNLIPHQPAQTGPAPERPLTTAFLDRPVSEYSATLLHWDLKSHRCPFSLHVPSPVMDQTFWWMWSTCQKIADHPREICSAEPTTSDPGSPPPPSTGLRLSGQHETRSLCVLYRTPS